jgi:hypothetical protein
MLRRPTACCYCGVPNRAYRLDGTQRPPYPGQVLWSANFDPDSLETLTYQVLIEVADEVEVEGDLCFA